MARIEKQILKPLLKDIDCETRITTRQREAMLKIHNKVQLLFDRLSFECGTESVFASIIPINKEAYDHLVEEWKKDAVLVFWNKIKKQGGKNTPDWTDPSKIRVGLAATETLPLAIEMAKLNLAVPFFVRSITKLDLSGTKLKVIPSELASCIQLKKLNLSHNQISIISDSFSKLDELRSLSLKDNYIFWISARFGDFTKLQSLNLRDNQIKELSSSCGKLTQLKTLSLAKNQLKKIPDSIGDLHKLTFLDLSRNRFQSVPSCLNRLTQAQYLCLHHNRIYKTPENIDKRVQKVLCLKFNFLPEVKDLPIDIKEQPPQTSDAEGNQSSETPSTLETGSSSHSDDLYDDKAITVIPPNTNNTTVLDSINKLRNVCENSKVKSKFTPLLESLDEFEEIYKKQKQLKETIGKLLTT